MKSPLRTMATLLAVLAVLLLSLSGCELISSLLGPGDQAKDPLNPSNRESATAADYAEEAAALLEAGDFSGALSKYTQGLLWDATNAEIVMGYVSLNMASILADPAVVDYMQSHLGIVDYPETINDVLDYSGWMETVTMQTTQWNPTTEQYEPSTSEFLFPTVSGQRDHDADGDVDMMDRALSLAEFAALNNDGLEDLLVAVDSALGERLDQAVEAMDTYVTEDMRFEYRWSMFYDTYPDETEWPFVYSSPGTPGEPLVIVIGQAEIKALAAWLQMSRALVNFSRVYTFSFDLAGFWNYYSPEGSGTADRPEVPFDQSAVHQLFALQSDAEARLAVSRGALSLALTYAQDAITAAAANRTGYGYILASDSPVIEFGDNMEWLDWVAFMGLEKGYLREVQESLDDPNGDTPAYLPISVRYNDATRSFSYYNYETDQSIGFTVSGWVSAPVLGAVVEANFGAFFSNPIVLYGATGLVNLRSDGEPVFYETADSVTFTEVTQATMDAFENDFSASNPQYYLRFDYTQLLETAPLVNFPDFMLDSMVGNFIYVPVAYAAHAWNSFTVEGTPGTDSAGFPMTSTGSFWWDLMQFAETRPL